MDGCYSGSTKLVPKVRKQDSGYARAGEGRDVVDGEKVAANGREVAVLYRALFSGFGGRGKRGEGRGREVAWVVK